MQYKNNNYHVRRMSIEIILNKSDIITYRQNEKVTTTHNVALENYPRVLLTVIYSFY